MFVIEKKTAVAPGEELLIACSDLEDEDFIEVEMVYARKGKPLSSPYTKTFYFTAA